MFLLLTPLSPLNKPIVVVAYMYISLGMMRDYNFVDGRPSICNYGKTGRIIGDEIGYMWESNQS